MTSVRYALRTRSKWHPRRRRIARLRALYWIVIRRHETELCCRCGGPVGVVYHVPNALWMERCGFPGAPGGVLCIPCIDEFIGEGEGFPRWTCRMDDEVMVG